jgi:arylsulfatase A-like enzyme
VIDHLRKSAAGGAAAGAVYGTVETLFAVILRWWIFQESFVPPSASFTLFLLVLYPVAGAAVGVVLAIATAPFGHQQRRTISGFQCACIGLACLANAAVLPDLSKLLVFAVAFLLVIAATARVLFIANPWTASALLLAPLWMVKELLDQNASPWNPVIAGTVVLGLLGVVYTLSRKVHWAAGPWMSFATFSLATLLALSVGSAPVRHRGTYSAPPRDPLPNILLVAFDTVRADHLSLYGYDRRTAPNLEAFARAATVYERAYAPSNATLPTHAAWFTGLWPSEHGAHFDEQARQWRPISANAVTLAETLAARGYVTASVAANYIFLGPRYGLDRGFEYVDARPPHTPFGDYRQYYLRARVAKLIDRFGGLPPTTHLLARSAEEINTSAIAMVDRLRQDPRPFLLFVNYMDAHSPCIPPEPYASMFEGRDPQLPLDLFNRMMVGPYAGASARVDLPPHQERHLISQYDGSIAYMDDAFARLVDALRSRGLFDETMIVVTSDHGEAFGSRGLIGHGTSNYDDQIRVPLVVKTPGQSRPSVRHEPVSTMLVHDLIRDAARLEPSRSLPPVVSEAFPPLGGTATERLVHPGRAIVAGRYKFIENISGDVELYDLLDDPHETRDLSGIPAWRAVTAHLHEALGAWRKKRRSSDLTPMLRMDADLQNRLRSLGYVH